MINKKHDIQIKRTVSC